MLDSSVDFKEQMAETRRTQILMGAAQVFTQGGYHKSTTKQIAKAAGVSEGTIYNYFSNKRELLLALIDFIGMRSIENVMMDGPPDDPKALIVAVLRDRFQLARQQGHFLAPILAEAITDRELREVLYQQIAIPLSYHIEQYLQEYIDAGKLRPFDVAVVTRAFLGAVLLNFALKLSELDSRYKDISSDILIEQLANLFLDGLLVDNK